MALILSHQTACEYWLSPYADIRSGLVSLRKNGRELNFAPNADLVHDYFSSMRKVHKLPFHTMTLNRNARHRIKGTKCHLSLGIIPPSSFYCLDEEVFVISPELCFFQMASMLNKVQLVKLGFDLCSKYSLDSQGYLYERIPVTTTERLEQYGQSLSGFHGARSALSTLSKVCSDSASPRETELAMLLSLPYSWGGYNLSNPRLNVKIPIPSSQRHIFTKNYYVCDLIWNDSIAVEYESDYWHTGVDRIASDSARRSALSLLGVEVITVTNKQIKNISEMDRIGRLLARKLNRPFRLSRGYDYRSRQKELRQELLIDKGSWN